MTYCYTSRILVLLRHCDCKAFDHDCNVNGVLAATQNFFDNIQELFMYKLSRLSISNRFIRYFCVFFLFVDFLLHSFFYISFSLHLFFKYGIYVLCNACFTYMTQSFRHQARAVRSETAHAIAVYV